MSKAELEKLIMEETKELSSDILMEVLDFIQFIKAKKYKRTTRKSFEKKLAKELTDLNNISLIHLEEEFANYKELYPREQ
ncbi:MAG: hypothetical protein D6813_05840 [Calditrichaeota bacterium]|nr:MAG: hypothetical protein D6813_05840 [Calditrichota bacterium]